MEAKGDRKLKKKKDVQRRSPSSFKRVQKAEVRLPYESQLIHPEREAKEKKRAERSQRTGRRRHEAKVKIFSRRRDERRRLKPANQTSGE